MEKEDILVKKIFSVFNANPPTEYTHIYIEPTVFILNHKYYNIDFGVISPTVSENMLNRELVSELSDEEIKCIWTEAEISCRDGILVYLENVDIEKYVNKDELEIFTSAEEVFYRVYNLVRHITISREKSLRDTVQLKCKLKEYRIRLHNEIFEYMKAI